MLDLNLHFCLGLPASALSPLSSCTALKQLDIRHCTILDIALLASCHDLRRLYIFKGYNQPDMDLEPLKGRMPRLVVRVGWNRTEDLDARSL